MEHPIESGRQPQLPHDTHKSQFGAHFDPASRSAAEHVVFSLGCINLS